LLCDQGDCRDVCVNGQMSMNGFLGGAQVTQRLSFAMVRWGMALSN